VVAVSQAGAAVLATPKQGPAEPNAKPKPTVVLPPTPDRLYSFLVLVQLTVWQSVWVGLLVRRTGCCVYLVCLLELRLFAYLLLNDRSEI
jgi:hypothetical protein